MSVERQKEVIVVQRDCPHFRIVFFERLREELQKKGIRLRVCFGHPSGFLKDGSLYYPGLPWGEVINIRYFVGKLTWQPVLKDALGADLVIVEAASKLVLNYLLLLMRPLGGPRVAFWGHGWSHQAENPDVFHERLKLWMGKYADWYFAYTWKVKEGLIKRGYDRGRITDVQNAVPVPSNLEVSEADVTSLREELGLEPGAAVALYCGRMYPNKRISFMIEAAIRVKQKVPSFSLLMAGDGSDAPIARRAAEEHDFIHYIGPLFGTRKSAVFALSRMVVMPGLVGLGAVDAFHFETPIVTTAYPYHSPEFVYLKHGENALISEDDVQSFVDAIVDLSIDDTLHSRLVTGCRESSQSITVDEMVRRFKGGIVEALGMGGH